MNPDAIVLPTRLLLVATIDVGVGNGGTGVGVKAIVDHGAAAKCAAQSKQPGIGEVEAVDSTSAKSLLVRLTNQSQDGGKGAGTSGTCGPATANPACWVRKRSTTPLAASSP